MMRVWSVVALSLALVSSVVVRADAGRLKSAESVLTDMSGSFDRDIPRDLITKAQCIVIVPSVKKAALGVGGEYGRGYMSCRKAGGWSAPGGVRIEGGSVGFQIGGTATDLLFLVMNAKGMDRLLSSKFTLGADAAAAAGPVGRQAQAQTDVTMMAEILTWSRSRGVFAGISLKGATLREDGSENQDLYGKPITNRELVQGSVKAPGLADGLMKALAKY
jgi:lipid-binding SYLF domain-containing protein